jgi:hypothetical protein
VQLDEEAAAPDEWRKVKGVGEVGQDVERRSSMLRGGDKGVILLMSLRFPFPFIQEVLLPGQTTIDGTTVPIIFCMTP